MEYAKDGIRVNAVVPGTVYTPMHRNTPKDVM
jgi:NAD(P)-dependent dehydrogenase (short-subunit alcohol dehydrogenase family)